MKQFIILLALFLLYGACQAQIGDAMIFGPAVIPSSGINITVSNCSGFTCYYDLASVPLTLGKVFTGVWVTGSGGPEFLQFAMTARINDTTVIDGTTANLGSEQDGLIQTEGLWFVQIQYSIASFDGSYLFQLEHIDVGNMLLSGPAFPSGFNVTVSECLGEDCVWASQTACSPSGGQIFLHLFQDLGVLQQISMNQVSSTPTTVAGTLDTNIVPSNTTLPQGGCYAVTLRLNTRDTLGIFTFISQSAPAVLPPAALGNGNMLLIGPAFPSGVNITIGDCIGTTCEWTSSSVCASAALHFSLYLFTNIGAEPIGVLQEFGSSTSISGKLGQGAFPNNATIPQVGCYFTTILFNQVQQTGDFVLSLQPAAPVPPPVPPPITAPVSSPMAAPVSPPVSTPSVVPAPSPLSPPTGAPVSPTEPPISSPAQVPVSEPVTIAPIEAPTTTPTAEPIEPLSPIIPIESQTPTQIQNGIITDGVIGGAIGLTLVGGILALVVIKSNLAPLEV